MQGEDSYAKRIKMATKRLEWAAQNFRKITSCVLCDERAGFLDTVKLKNGRRAHIECLKEVKSPFE